MTATAGVHVRVGGPDGQRLASVLRDAGVDVDPNAATLVHATFSAPALDALEDALAGWIEAARDVAAFGGDIVTVVGDALLDGDDPAALALAHGLLSATRAYAMERERSGELANLVAADPGALDRAASTVAWLVRERAVSGELLQAGARRHGRQRL